MFKNSCDNFSQNSHRVVAGVSKFAVPESARNLRYGTLWGAARRHAAVFSMSVWSPSRFGPSFSSFCASSLRSITLDVWWWNDYLSMERSRLDMVQISQSIQKYVLNRAIMFCLPSFLSPWLFHFSFHFFISFIFFGEGLECRPGALSFSTSQLLMLYEKASLWQFTWPSHGYTTPKCLICQMKRKLGNNYYRYFGNLGNYFRHQGYENCNSRRLH